MTRDEAIEGMAQEIYKRLPVRRDAIKPAWVPNGNSIKQDEARSYAAAAYDWLTANGMAVVSCNDMVDAINSKINLVGPKGGDGWEDGCIFGLEYGRDVIQAAKGTEQ